jgi:hypothetical protein
MGQKKYILKIDASCSQSWSNMTAVSQGRYCEVCAKNVIDFTTMSDSEIVRLLEKQQGNICGKLNTTQLNRVIQIQERQHLGSRLYKFLTGLFFLSGLNSLQAQNNEPKTPEIIQTEARKSTNETLLEKEKLQTIPTETFFYGKVWADGQPLPDASIHLKGTTISTTSDFSGGFRLKIEEKYMSDTMVFMFSYSGYKTREIKKERKFLNEKVNVTLYEDKSKTTLGGMMIHSYE